MIQKLKRRLQVTFILATGLLLTIIVTGLCLLSYKQYERNQLRQFEGAFGAIVEKLEEGGSLSHSWLAKTEVEGKLAISIFSNQALLSFPGAYQTDTDREKLFAKLRTFANRDGFFSNQDNQRKKQSSIYLVLGEKKEWYYGVIQKTIINQKRVEVWALQRIEEEKEIWNPTFFGYLLLEVFGILGLALIGRIFVEHTLKPVEEGLIRQKEFIAAASHELRAPLTVIRTGLSTIEGEPESAQQWISGMKEESIRMTRLIDDLLTLASSDARGWLLKKEEVMPDTFLISCYDALAGLCTKKKQRFEMMLPDYEMTPICMDCQRILQVLMILVDNAASYSAAETKIELLAREEKKSLILEVIDHGCGIPKEDKQRIFERFYSLDKSRGKKEHFGLGLSIASEIVKQHHARIFVKDTQGGGSTFVVEIFY